jgi:1-acyl-sn-glycerol-3-phosphate acyltransferase
MQAGLLKPSMPRPLRRLLRVASSDTDAARAVGKPAINQALLAWFRWYSCRALARNFHAVRWLRGSFDPRHLSGPAVFYTNHAGWWDPLIMMGITSQLLPGRSSYAPISAAALEKYRFFARLGFFGVEQNTSRGAVTFLRTAERILSEPANALWLTPQGRFADVRERPLRFKPGIGHVARRLPGVSFVPLAIEYTFWEESRPEALLHFGSPVVSEMVPGQLTPEAWSQRFEANLETTQNTLAAAAVQRDPASFETLIAGSSGVGGVYDAWRWLKASLRGEKFQASHGTR